jgi:hypothetical protein
VNPPQGSPLAGLRWRYLGALLRLATALLVAALTAGAVEPPRGFERAETELSPRGTFTIEYYGHPQRYTYQVWLSSYANPTNRALLFAHDRSVAVLVSDDERWLLINNFSGSDTAEPLLFRRTSPIRYAPVGGIDLERKLWNAAAEQLGFPKDAMFDHRYAAAVCWMGETHKLLMRVWGHQSGEYYVTEWFCIYDADRDEISFDLAAANRGAFQRVKQP